MPQERSYTLEKVIAKGYDTYLAAFEVLVPALIRAYEKNKVEGNSSYSLISPAINMLKQWDYRCSESSVATTLGVYWGEKLLPAIYQTVVPDRENNDQVGRIKQFAATTSSEKLLVPFAATIRELNDRFGNWQISRGAVNRFQRISSDIENKFDDNQPSYPVGFASSAWGMIPSYSSRAFPGTKKRYGVNGNSFICAVEFGKKIKAKSLLAGGESGDEHSVHFFDQGLMYSKGQFKDVWFYKEDVLQHIEKKYHPGEE